MAIIREVNYSDTYITYLSTLGLLCGISCTIVMIRFKGFKASLNITSSKPSGKHYELAPHTSVVGAYRTSKEEYFGNINYLDSRKTITPSMVKLPPSTQPHVAGNIKPSKSTGDLVTIQNVPTEVRKSTPNISGQNAAQETKDAKNQSKAQKKLEKDRLIEQKKREKLAAQEREKQEKLRKEREKQAAQQQTKEAKEREKQRKKKGVAPQPKQQTTAQRQSVPQPRPATNTQRDSRAPQKRDAPQPPQFKKVVQRTQPNANPLSQKPTQDSRNSLESSISRSSGPPPYSDSSEVPNASDSSGNVTFVKSPQESSSWDMISQHRQQMSRTAGVAVHSSKQNVDLQYNVGNIAGNDRDNSEA